MTLRRRLAENYWVGPAAMIASAGCWGCATAMSKSALGSCAPLPLLLVQLSASVLFLWLVFLLGGNRQSMSRAIWRPGLLGLLEPGLAYLFGTLGLARSSASIASIIMGSEPLMVLGVGALCFHQKITLSIFRWALVAFIGLVAIISVSEGHGSATLAGSLWITAGTLCAAVYVILSGRTSKSHDALHLAACQQSVALILIMALCHLEGSTISVARQLSASQLFFAMLSGVIQYGLALWAYLIAVQRMSTVRAALYLNLIPIFGLGSACLFLGDRLIFEQWVGAGLILFALSRTRTH